MTCLKTNYMTIALLCAIQANRAIAHVPNVAALSTYRSSITQTDFDQHEKYLGLLAKEREQERIRAAFLAGKYSEIVLDEHIPSRVKHYMRIDLRCKSKMTFAMGGPVFF